MELEIEGKKEYSLSSVDLPHCLDCSTLSEAARVIHCNICDCWHSSLYLIIFPMYTCPLLAKDKAGGKMLLCWFLIITFLVSIFTAFSFTHTLHGVGKCQWCAFLIFTQQHADTSVFSYVHDLQMWILNHCLRETSHSTLISDWCSMIKKLNSTSLCFYRTVNEFKVHVYMYNKRYM